MNCVIDDISLQVPAKTLKQMIFIANALENGWSVRKAGKNYVFTDRLEGRSEVYEAGFLDAFVRENTDMRTFLAMVAADEEAGPGP
jgi:hypothetical protein